MKKMALHWKIILGMILGVLFSLTLLNTSWGKEMIVTKEGEIKKNVEWEVIGDKAEYRIKVKDTKEVKSRAKHFVQSWIKPFGIIFINLLKLIAIPLIVASLIKGISDLKDISKLSKMGGRTIGIYILIILPFFVAVIYFIYKL